MTDRTRWHWRIKRRLASYFVATYPRFLSGRRTRSHATRTSRCSSRRSRVCRSGSTSTIPFCGSAVTSCYSASTTDKNAQRWQDYLDVLAREWELYASQPAIAGRPLNSSTSAAGTPSFLSTTQLGGLVSRLKAIAPWDQAEEGTFECETGTLTEPKLAAIRSLGVTRLSLGVETSTTRSSS